MKRACLLLTATSWLSLPPVTAESEQVSPELLFERVSPAVVRIETKDDFGQPAAIGSGFAIPFEAATGSAEQDAETQVLNMLSGPGFRIVTNFHVIRGAVTGSIQFHDGRRLDIGFVEREDEILDLAVLRASSNGAERPKPLAVLPIDSSPVTASPAGSPPVTMLRVGSRVFAIGSPVGLTNTLSEGLVSGFRERSAGADWIQTTAPISPGSSGGPLLNANGEVVGITTALIKGGQNLNFAIPVSDVQELLRRPGQVFRNLSTGRSFKLAEPAAYYGLRSRLWTQYQDETGAKLERDEAKAGFASYLKTRKQDPAVLLLLAYEQYVDSEYVDSLQTLESAARIVGSGESIRARKNAERGQRIDYLVYHLMARVCYALDSEGADTDPEHHPGGRAAHGKTIAAAKQAIDLNPNFAPTHDLLCRVYSSSGQLIEALAEAESLLKLVPYCGQAHGKRGEVLQMLGRHEHAIADFLQALELNPSDARSASLLGVAYSAIGKHNEAIAAHQHALELQEPEHAWFNHCELAEEYEKLNNLELAIREFGLAADGCPDLKMREGFQSRIARCRAKLNLNRR